MKRPLSAAESEHLALISSLVVKHPSFEHALELATECVERGESRVTPSCLLIVGPSGCGKTTLARVLRAAFPAQSSAEAEHLPMLLVEIPPDPTIKNLAAAILAAMGVRLPWRVTTNELTREILRWLKLRGVRAIVLDEIQHFAEQTSYQVRMASDYLKALINSADLPIILLGLERSQALLDANEQLRRRFMARAVLARFGYGEPHEQVAFQKFLRAIDQQLRLAAPGGFSEPDLAFRFHCATAGLPAHVMTIVLAAAETVIRSNRDRIAMTDLEAAFRDHIWHEAHEKLNPFSRKFVGRPLVLEGEPFAYLARIEEGRGR